jgi:hypothetical protein
MWRLIKSRILVLLHEQSYPAFLSGLGFNMVLEAFLEPGLYPVYLMDPGNRERLWGHIYYRVGRPLSWLAQCAAQAGSLHSLSLELPGFRILPDGTLLKASEELASVNLIGVVAASRPFRNKNVFVLRFRSMLRLMD